jgi:hypothetical protein
VALKRKQVQVTEEEKRKVAQFAALNDTNESALCREWVEGFIEHGTEFVQQPYARLQMMLPAETLQRALDRCDQDGVTLQDVIRHEIAQIDQL